LLKVVNIVNLCGFKALEYEYSLRFINTRLFAEVL